MVFNLSVDSLYIHSNLIRLISLFPKLCYLQLQQTLLPSSSFLFIFFPFSSLLFTHTPTQTNTHTHTHTNRQTHYMQCVSLNLQNPHWSRIPLISFKHHITPPVLENSLSLFLVATSSFLRIFHRGLPLCRRRT